MASGTDYATSAGATVGGETGGGGKSGTSVGVGSSNNAVAGTIGQDYYTSQIIYPDGIQVNPEDGTPMINKSTLSPRQDGERIGLR